MRTYEISSPAAAELYFNSSFVGDVASLVGAALAGFGGGRRDTRRQRPRAIARVEAQKRGLLDRLERMPASPERDWLLASSRRRRKTTLRARATYTTSSGASRRSIAAA